MSHPQHVSRERGRPDRAEASRARPRPVTVAIPAAAFLAIATAFMLNGVEPFASWYYISAWYPTLILMDCAVAASSGEYHALSRPRYAVSLLAWSAVLWFFFELFNFRVQNWYYVFITPDRAPRWFGTAIAFATVFPAIFLAYAFLESRGLWKDVRWPKLPVRAWTPIALVVAGLASAALSLAWPRLFFPLIWGALTLLIEPYNYRRDPDRSLLGDLERGRPGRILRLLAAGLAVGFIWELYNIESRTKWIYTVPGFEEVKLFEMPVLGFLGFTVFALDCFVVYQALVLAGVAVPGPGFESTRARFRRGRTAAAGAAAAVFSVLVLIGMERWNTDSHSPRLDGLWLLDDNERAALIEAGYGDPFALADAPPQELAAAAGAPVEQTRTWVEAARLATLRGIGTDNARELWGMGIRSVEDLAAADPDRLSERLRAASDRPRAGEPARVRVWVRAAARESGS